MLENLKADLSVEALAERIGMSPRHFSRVCLREMKMNPGQFVDRLRVEAAQQMIDSSSMGLKSIDRDKISATIDDMHQIVDSGGFKEDDQKKLDNEFNSISSH